MALNPRLAALIKDGRSKYASRGNSKIIKLKEGKTRVRVMPAIGEDGKFWADLGVHWIKPEKQGKPVAVVGCHEKVYDKPCPVCDAISKSLDAAMDSQSEEVIKEWRSRKSALLNAIIRDGADKGDLGQILEVPATVIDGIFAVMQTYADDDIDALDAADGVDFIIERRGKGFDTEYSVTVPPKSVALTKAQLDSRVELLEVIEKEFFRGEENKALNQITQITGVSISNGHAALSNGRATQKALTGQVAEGADDFAQDVPFDVENPNSDTVVEAAKAPAPAPKKVAAVKPAPAPAPALEADALDGEDMTDLMAELDGLTAE